MSNTKEFVEKMVQELLEDVSPEQGAFILTGALMDNVRDMEQAVVRGDKDKVFDLAQVVILCHRALNEVGCMIVDHTMNPKIGTVQ